jgi:hypothetical protein
LLEEWKESIIVPIYKKGDETDCNNYGVVSHLQTTCKILSNTLLSSLSQYAEEIIKDLQYGIRRIGSTTVIYSAFIKYWGKKGIQRSSATAL